MEEGVEEQPDQPINNILQEILRKLDYPMLTIQKTIFQKFK